MEPNFFVRDLHKEDVDVIHDLAMKSWKYTYREIFTKDFIENYVNRAYRKENLENTVEQEKKGLFKFYVLEKQDEMKLVGFAQIGYDRYWETGKRENDLRLFRIYLDPEYIGKRLGNLLLENVEQFVAQEGLTSYIVGVHEKNIIGLRFYQKMGFILTSKTSDAEGEIYLRKQLED